MEQTCQNAGGITITPNISITKMLMLIINAVSLGMTGRITACCFNVVDVS